MNLDVEMRNKLDEVAKTHGISRSELTNALLEQGLKAERSQGEPFEVCFGSSRGRSMRVASDGEMDVTQGQGQRVQGICWRSQSMDTPGDHLWNQDWCAR